MKPASKAVKNGKTIRFLMEIPVSRASSIKKIFGAWAGISFREVPFNQQHGETVSAMTECQEKVQLLVTVSCQNFDTFVRVCFKENVNIEAA